jgi:hypothetical protein
MNFDLGHFPFFLLVFFLCVIYPEGRSVRINTQKGLSWSFFSLWKLSLRQILKNFHLGHFIFFLLVFFLSVEVLLETDPNEFYFGNFPYYSYFSSLCVKYPQEKVSLHKNIKQIFLSLSSLCGFFP